MCPVDYVASAVVEIAAQKEALSKPVFHIWNSQGFRFDDMFAHLTKLEYPVEATDYMHWRSSLMDLTLSAADNALYPLLHFVLDDLPTSTKSPELDDSNTRAIAERSQGRVVCHKVDNLMPLYLGYFVQVGFLDSPPKIELPVKAEWDQIKGKMVSRSQN
jgi:L-aminoadipate-semialdehyde dehydrogenase